LSCLAISTASAQISASACSFDRASMNPRHARKFPANDDLGLRAVGQDAPSRLSHLLSGHPCQDHLHLLIDRCHLIGVYPHLPLKCRRGDILHVPHVHEPLTQLRERQMAMADQLVRQAPRNSRDEEGRRCVLQNRAVPVLQDVLDILLVGLLAWVCSTIGSNYAQRTRSTPLHSTPPSISSQPHSAQGTNPR
jgi:hypothetical protein